VVITFVGTGSAFSRNFGQTNALVEAGDVSLMIDFGFMTPRRLESIGHGMAELTHVAISHLHADHTGGLEELAFTLRYGRERRPYLLTPPALAEELWDQSLRGGLEWVSDAKGQTEKCSLETYFRIAEASTSWTNLGALELRAFPTDHVPGKRSWGFIVREAGSGYQAVFGGDTRRPYGPLLEEPLGGDFARGPIFHDCTLSASAASAIHIGLAEIAYPPAIQERVVLVHYEDDLDAHLGEIRAASLRFVRPGVAIQFPDWRSCLG